MQPTNSNPMTPWQICMSLSQRVHQLHYRLDEQQAVINRLMKQIDGLTEQMKNAESRPLYHIDSLAYHFDQLKVEKLDGTLNIGMTPPSEETVKEIGQLVMPGPSETKVQNPPQGGPFQPSSVFGGIDANQIASSGPNQFPSPSPPLVPDAANLRPPYPEIRQEADLYLNTRAPVKLIQLEAEFGMSLDPYHRKLIIEDIRKQISPRIQYYLQSLKPNETGNSAPLPDNELRQIKSGVLSKTTHDIDNALRSYITRLQSNTNQS